MHKSKCKIIFGDSSTKLHNQFKILRISISAKIDLNDIPILRRKKIWVFLQAITLCWFSCVFIWICGLRQDMKAVKQGFPCLHHVTNWYVFILFITSSLCGKSEQVYVIHLYAFQINSCISFTHFPRSSLYSCLLWSCYTSLRTKCCWYFSPWFVILV